MVDTNEYNQGSHAGSTIVSFLHRLVESVCEAMLHKPERHLSLSQRWQLYEQVMIELSPLCNRKPPSLSCIWFLWH